MMNMLSFRAFSQIINLMRSANNDDIASLKRGILMNVVIVTELS